MSRRLLLAIVAVGLAIVALSLVQGWIVHEREVRGEGYRFVEVQFNAWSGASVPVVAVGVTVAGALAAAAAIGAVRAVRVPAWIFVVGSIGVIGCFGAVVVPVAQDGHASSVDLSPGWALGAGLLLAGGMLAAALALTRPAARWLVAGAVAIAVLVAAGGAARWQLLQWNEGLGRHWSEGSYTRTATDGEPTETLTIDGERVTIGDRWGGSWEWSGWTVVIDNDPACPDSRGTYHAHGVNDDDLRFVKVVDTCMDGARAADLETGIWERVP